MVNCPALSSPEHGCSETENDCWCCVGELWRYGALTVYRGDVRCGAVRSFVLLRSVCFCASIHLFTSVVAQFFHASVFVCFSPSFCTLWPHVKKIARVVIESIVARYSLHVRTRSSVAWLYMPTVEDGDQTTQLLAGFMREPGWEESLVEWRLKLRRSCANFSTPVSLSANCSLERMNCCQEVHTNVSFWLLMASAMMISRK